MALSRARCGRKCRSPLVGAPFPARAAMPSPLISAPCAIIPHASNSCAGMMAGLASLPNSLAGLTAVPDLRARPVSTRPSPPGADATILWSRSVVAAQPQDSRPAPYWTCSHAGREARRVSRRATTPSAVSYPATDPAGHVSYPSRVDNCESPRSPEQTCESNISSTKLENVSETAPTHPNPAHSAANTEACAAEYDILCAAIDSAVVTG